MEHQEELNALKEIIVAAIEVCEDLSLLDLILKLLT